MGKGQVTADELLARAHPNGYKRGEHNAADEIRGRGKHVKETKKDQARTFGRYVPWQLGAMNENVALKGLPSLDKDVVWDRCLSKGTTAPELANIKDFLRFYVATSKPQISIKPTRDSVQTVAGWFFAGFTRVTGTDTDADDRSESF